MFLEFLERVPRSETDCFSETVSASAMTMVGTSVTPSRLAFPDALGCR